MPLKFDKPYAIIVGHPRSGTHLLESCLACHPKVHKRSECVLRYKQLDGKTKLSAELRKKTPFINHPGYVNLAIVMYAELPLLEQLCGPLAGFKIIHLLRDPLAVARSYAQWEANKALHGKKARAHYKTAETPLPNAPVPEKSLRTLANKVKKLQTEHAEILASHPATLTVHYEDFTQNEQVAELPADFADEILKFIGLRPHRLACDLRKTGS